jgi:hypothetical protein
MGDQWAKRDAQRLLPLVGAHWAKPDAQRSPVRALWGRRPPPGRVLSVQERRQSIDWPPTAIVGPSTVRNRRLQYIPLQPGARECRYPLQGLLRLLILRSHPADGADRTKPTKCPTAVASKEHQRGNCRTTKGGCRGGNGVELAGGWGHGGHEKLVKCGNLPARSQPSSLNHSANDERQGGDVSGQPVIWM